MSHDTKPATLSLEEKRRLLVQRLQGGGQGQDRFPLSFAQQRLWVVHQMDPESAAYNMPYALRLRGTLTLRLRRALALRLRRALALRLLGARSRLWRALALLLWRALVPLLGRPLFAISLLLRSLPLRMASRRWSRP